MLKNRSEIWGWSSSNYTEGIFFFFTNWVNVFLVKSKVFAQSIKRACANKLYFKVKVSCLKTLIYVQREKKKLHLYTPQKQSSGGVPWKTFLIISTKISGKNLCWSLFLIKLKAALHYIHLSSVFVYNDIHVTTDLRRLTCKIRGCVV